MKHKTSTQTGLLITMLALLASSPGLAEETVSEKPSADPAQFARGAKAWKDNCARCHNLRDPKELTDLEWEISVTHMRARANLPGDIAEDIKAFLKASN